MRSLKISSPAKVNLFLKVLGRRNDGYHELQTLFHRISLQDQIILRKISEPELRLITNHPKLSRTRSNIIFQVYQALQKVAKWEGGVEVKLKKNIPVAAGLGGGSSNAAHFMLGMNRLFNLKLSFKTSVQLGAQLGSDVPFFLYKVNQAIGTGRGEKIKCFPSKNKFWFVLIIPPFGIPTPLVYKRLKARPLTRISRDATITSADLRCNRDGYPPLHNDLFSASCRIRPELKRIDVLFDQLGATRRLMSGSGSTMFSIHKSRREAKRIAQIFKRRRPDVKIFICRTY